MTTYLRKSGGGRDGQIAIDEESWDLDVQLERVLAWMQAHPEFNEVGNDWIVDIGYEPRGNVAVAGYTVSVDLMAMLARKKVALWLSDYLNDKQAQIQDDNWSPRGSGDGSDVTD